MKKRIKVILDCDDVLYSCNQEAIRRLNEEYGTSYTLEDITEWGLTGVLIDERLKYYDDAKFIGNLPLLNGAKEFVKELSKKAEIFICTAVKPNCASERLSAIIRDFPEIKVNNIMIGGRKDMLVADFMLDDCILNLEKAQVTYPVLMQRPWNRNGNSGMLSVSSYDAFLKLVDTVISYEEVNDYQICSLIGAPGSGKTNVVNKLKEYGFEPVSTYTTARKSGEHYITVGKSRFLQLKNEGYFSETSVYMNNLYGVRNEDINAILKKKKIPLLMMDVNGTMSVARVYKTLSVFVEAPKQVCVKNILEKNLPPNMTVERICSLDGELKNKELCDLVVSGVKPNTQMIINMFL